MKVASDVLLLLCLHDFGLRVIVDLGQASRVEDWDRVRNWTLRLGQDEAEEAPEEQRERLDPGGRGRVYRLEGEATPKTTEALRKGADADRGRSRSHQEKSERN